MPIYKITVEERVTRKSVAYVDATDESAADDWAGDAPDHVFLMDWEGLPWSEVSDIEKCEAAPAGSLVHTLKDPS